MQLTNNTSDFCGFIQVKLVLVNCFSYRGIGIRIEDNVVMTETGPYVLTAGLAKEMADIEELMTG